MKEAWKDHYLDIGNIHDGLLISSGFWVVWIENRHVSNEIKAAVMLLSGTLPKPDEMFRVEKDKADPQYRIVDDLLYQYISRGDLYSKLIITPVLLTENHDIRMIQGPNRQIYGINQEFLDMIDPGEVDFDAGESTPTGPCFGRDINSGIYWYNDFGIVMILPIKTKKTEIPAVLSLLEFKEDGSIGKGYLRDAVGEVLGEYDATETALDDDTGGDGSSKNGQPDGVPETDDAEGAE
jgi:hypothetical protein